MQDTTLGAIVVRGELNTKIRQVKRLAAHGLVPSVREPFATDLDDDGREFIPTAELVNALDVEPTAFGRQMGELRCRPRPGRITTEDGISRQACGYLTAGMRATVAAQRYDPDSEDGPV